MATREQLIGALRQADAAGNFEDAKRIAQMINAQHEQNKVADIGNAIADIPRQIGLTARAGLSGALDVADFVASPIRGALNLIPGLNIKPSADTAADMLGLPSPQNPTERAVQSGARLTAGTLAPIGLANAAKPLFNTLTAASRPVAGDAKRFAAGLLDTFSATPATQAASSAGAGFAQQAAADKGAGVQTLGALLGGLAGAGGASAVSRTANSVKSASNALRQTLSPQSTALNVDVKINSILADSGITLSDLPKAAQNALRTAEQEAVKSGGTLSKDAAERLAQYSLIGATPTRAAITQDPIFATQQKNAAKMAANSNDPAAQRLVGIENENNNILLQKLNDLGAARSSGSFKTGEDISSALQSVADSRKANINELYNTAKSSSGRQLELEPYTFTDGVGRALDAELKAYELPGQFKSILNDISTGKLPLTLDVAEQLKTALATAQRGNVDGNVVRALGIVRDQLESTPLRAGNEMGQQTIDAFNKARSANRNFKNEQENNPALKAVIDGMPPDAIFEKFVVRSTAGGLESLMSALPQSQRDAVKSQVVDYLKLKATPSGDLGRLSGNAFGKALEGFGEARLKAIFNADEIKQLNAVAKVAKLEQNQPVGSAVNNSNTAPALMGFLEKIANSPVVSKIPLGKQFIQEPAINIAAGSAAKKALDVQSILPLVNQSLNKKSALSINPFAFGLLNLQ